MRHLKKANSAEKVFKGFREYYNYVRPHMTLEGRAPAEIAATPIQLGTNQWLDFQESRKKLAEWLVGGRTRVWLVPSI